MVWMLLQPSSLPPRAVVFYRVERSFSRRPASEQPASLQGQANAKPVRNAVQTPTAEADCAFGVASLLAKSWVEVGSRKPRSHLGKTQGFSVLELLLRSLISWRHRAPQLGQLICGAHRAQYLGQVFEGFHSKSTLVLAASELKGY